MGLTEGPFRSSELSSWKGSSGYRTHLLQQQMRKLRLRQEVEISQGHSQINGSAGMSPRSRLISDLPFHDDPWVSESEALKPHSAM